MRRDSEIKAANILLPDYIGFVFAESRRRVTLQEACRLRCLLDPKVGTAGVFVDAPPAEAAKAASMCRLSAVQLHGGEDGGYMAALRPLLPDGCEIWKAARVKNAGDIRAAVLTGADRLILDAFSPSGYGGTGQSFDWSIISAAGIDRPFFVAGGINAGNVRDAIKAAKGVKKPFGIDVSGGVETDGYKDFDKMAELIEIIRKEREEPYIVKAGCEHND